MTRNASQVLFCSFSVYRGWWAFKWKQSEGHGSVEVSRTITTVDQVRDLLKEVEARIKRDGHLWKSDEVHFLSINRL